MLDSTEQSDDPNVLRILLVEDDPDLRASLDEVLSGEGYEVIAVPSGAEAVSAASQTKFDLMITDIKLPGKDGLSTLEEVRSDNPTVAGIVITGYSTEDFALRAAKLQVKEYLKKPFELDPFLAAVDKVAQDKLRQHEQAQRALSAHMSVLHLSLSLLERSSNLDRGILEAALRAWRQERFPDFFEARERTILSCLMLKVQMQDLGIEFPSSYLEQLPKVFREYFELQDLQGSPFADFSSFLEQVDLVEIEEEAASVNLSGTLLNMALLFESGDRFDDAIHAFSEFLSQATHPGDRYLALFGLARIARQQQRFEAMSEYLDRGIQEASSLGGTTRLEAITEKGILQALSGLKPGQDTLREAQELSAKRRDAASYALSTLALEYFFGLANPKKNQILETLARPEFLQLVTEAGGWLLPLLLSSSTSEESQKLVSRLVRVCSKSFLRLMHSSADEKVLAEGLGFLGVLNEQQQIAIVDRLAGMDKPLISRKLETWRAQTRRERSLATTIRVLSFSGMRLYRNDDPVDLKRMKPLLLFLYLLVRRKPVGEMSIYETFWPGLESKAQASLRAALSFLRKLIAPERESDPFVRVGGTVAIADDVQLWFDYREFWDLVEQGQSAQSSQPQRTKSLFEAAVKLYRGPFLENVYDDWAIQAREAASVAYQDCLSFLVESSLKIENWEDVLDYSQQGLNRDDINQKLVEGCMLAMIHLGRHPEALTLFDKISARLEREYELEPSIEMVRLQQMARLNV